jgi:surface antigen
MCPHPAVTETARCPKRRHEKGREMKPMKILVKTRMTPRLFRLASLLAAGGLAATISATAAQAQMVNPFGTYNGPTLSTQDYDQARVVAVKLLNETPPEVGRYESWTNPASGNHGKFTILSIFTSQGMPCRKVKADVTYSKPGSHPRSFTLDACQIPSGQWKTVT